MDYAFDHHKKTNRAPRLAVNASSWWYTRHTRATVQKIRDRDGLHVNPIESSILYCVLRTLQLGIELHFVFDGGKRLSNGGRSYPGHDAPSELLRDTLTMIGVPWHEAPAEAEAECAKMEIDGLVDGVWSEDGDALAFGCKTLIKSHREVTSSTENGEYVPRSKTHFRIFRLEDIKNNHCGMDRDGFILYAIWNGQPKDVEDLPNLEAQDVLIAASKGLGKSLCAASSTQENLRQWATTELASYLRDARRDFQIPPKFPMWEHLQDYINPVVSTQKVLSNLPQPRNPFLDEKRLFAFLTDKFQWTVTKWVRYTLPVRIVRSLLATEEGEENQHDYLDLECDQLKKLTTKTDKSTRKKQIPKTRKVTATFLVCKATSIDTSAPEPEAARGNVETLAWILRKSNFNKTPSLKRYFKPTTPDPGQKGKSVVPASTSGISFPPLGPRINKAPLTPPSASPSSSNPSSSASSNGEGSSGTRGRYIRSERPPPSPTPMARKGNLQRAMEGRVTKNIREGPKDKGTSSGPILGSGKEKARKVPTSPSMRASSYRRPNEQDSGKGKGKESLTSSSLNANSKRARSPTDSEHSSNGDTYNDANERIDVKRARTPVCSGNSEEDLYNDVDNRPRAAAEQPSTPPAQITRPADAINNIIEIDSDSDSDDDAFEVMLTPPPRSSAPNNEDFITIDSDPGEDRDEDDYGSFPPESQLGSILDDAAVETAKDGGVADESSTDYGSFPASPDLLAFA